MASWCTYILPQLEVFGWEVRFPLGIGGDRSEEVLLGGVRGVEGGVEERNGRVKWRVVNGDLQRCDSPIASFFSLSLSRHL